jgi:hypothetical protein
MSYYVQRTARLALWSLRSQRDAMVRSVYPRTSVLGCLGIPAALVLLLFATAAWLLVFLLVPTLLICVWMVLQPYRLWLFFRSRTTGNRFFG